MLLTPITYEAVDYLKECCAKLNRWLQVRFSGKPIIVINPPGGLQRRGTRTILRFSDAGCRANEHPA